MFLAYEDPAADILVGLLRLRKCSDDGAFRPEFVLRHGLGSCSASASHSRPQRCGSRVDTCRTAPFHILRTSGGPFSELRNISGSRFANASQTAAHSLPGRAVQSRPPGGLNVSQVHEGSQFGLVE
jgi:hypothetical protein